MTADKTTRFEDRLLSELKKDISLNAVRQDAEGVREPAPRRRLVTAPRLGLAAAGGAAVVAGAVLAPGAMAPPAYAVEERPDGSVSVSIHELSLEKDQQRALAVDLRSAGVPVEVHHVADGYRCAGPAEEGMTVLPLSGESSERLKAVEVSPDESGESPVTPLDGTETPFDVTIEEGDSMIIENYVLRRGEPHRTAYRVGSDLKLCETEPIPDGPGQAE